MSRIWTVTDGISTVVSNYTTDFSTKFTTVNDTLSNIRDYAKKISDGDAGETSFGDNRDIYDIIVKLSQIHQAVIILLHQIHLVQAQEYLKV